MAKDHISVEPLLNQSAIGDGSDKKIGMIPIDTAGVASHRTAITVDSTAQEITITPGKRTIEIQNFGAKNIYYGGVSVTSSSGVKIFPSQGKVFSNVSDTFSIYLVADGVDTSEVRIVELS